MKDVDYGKVERYLEDKGFGFVSRTFTKSSFAGDLFFHINTVRRADPQLARQLNSFDLSNAPYFWYEFERTAKGLQITSLINPLNIGNAYPKTVKRIVAAIKKVWVDESNSLNDVGRLPALPESIERAAFDIIPSDELNRMSLRRLAIEKEKRHARRDGEGIDSTKKREELIKALVQKRIEEDEFSQLVEEMSSLGFTHSKQVSQYIVRHKLGHKYQNISGILQMKMHGDEWSFNGGFPPAIYGRLCRELGLDNEHSEAKPGQFKSYKELGGGGW